MNTGTARNTSYKPTREVDVENILKEASIGLRNLLEVDNSEKSSIKRMLKKVKHYKNSFSQIKLLNEMVEKREMSERVTE